METTNISVEVVIQKSDDEGNSVRKRETAVGIKIDKRPTEEEFKNFIVVVLKELTPVLRKYLMNGGDIE